MEIQLQPAEESCPYYQWLQWLINLADFCVKKAHLKNHQGYKYQATNHWMGLIFFSFQDLSLDESADRLNDILWEVEWRHQRRKVQPKSFNGSGNRKERKCPNGDQLRKYRNTLPKWVIDRLNHFIFDCQIEYALEHGLISSRVEVIVDNTDEWYYGCHRYPKDQYITQGHNGPGTKRKRKYLGIMLKSGMTYLYCGVDIIKKKHSNVPKILEIIDWLIQKGFTITNVLGDRWFPTYELLAELQVRGVTYVGPYKKYAPVKKALIYYLNHGGKYIIPYTIRGAPAKFYHSPGIQCTLIITNGRGRRLRDVRKDYLSGIKTQKECLKELMVMLITQKPPTGKKRRQGWATQIFRRYKHRWQIETGFRDLNRIAPPSNAHTNERKLFMACVRYWVYNCWQLERAKRRQLRRCPKSWKKGPTLRRFTYCVTRQEAGTIIF